MFVSPVSKGSLEFKSPIILGVPFLLYFKVCCVSVLKYSVLSLVCLDDAGLQYVVAMYIGFCLVVCFGVYWSQSSVCFLLMCTVRNWCAIVFLTKQAQPPILGFLYL